MSPLPTPVGLPHAGGVVTLAGAGFDPITSLPQYGVLGIFAVILIFLSRTLIGREQERADRLDAEVNRLNALIQDKTIPALITATSAIQASQQYLQTLQYQRDVEAESAARMERFHQERASS